MTSLVQESEYHCIAPKFTLYMKGKPARELDSSQTRVYVSETEGTPREVCIECDGVSKVFLREGIGLHYVHFHA